MLLTIAIAIGLQLLFTYAPFINHLFGTEPLDALSWLACLTVGLIVFVLVEIEKSLFRRYQSS